MDSLLRSADYWVSLLGRAFLSWIGHTANLIAFTRRLWRLTVRKPFVGRAMVHRIVVEQIYFTAVQALPILIPIALIVGGMLIVYFSKVAGHYDLGKITVLIIVRELGPLITAVIVILRSAVAVTVEMSYMRILNETESIEMMGIDPLHVLGYPRLIGITSAMLCLFIVFDLCAIFGGNLIAWALSAADVEHLTHQMALALSPSDIVVGVVKALCFGVLITSVSLYRGFTIEKRMTAIPVACSRGAMETLWRILIINIVVSVLFYI